MNTVQRISLVKKPAIIFIALLCLSVVISASPTIFAKKPGKLKAIRIGVLLPPEAFNREAIRSAVNFAVQEVNELLSVKQTYLEVYFKDLDSPDPPLALLALEDLLAEKPEIQFVIGPFFSGQVMAIMEYANANGIVVVSQSSTHPGLAQPDDNIFRFCPQEASQGSALASVLDDRASQVCVVYPEQNAVLDIYETAYNEKTEHDFAYEIPYDPYDPNEPNWAAAVAFAIDSAVEDGADGVLFIGGANEARDLFVESAEYDDPWEVSWFGTDWTVGSTTLIEDPVAGGFASFVGFTATSFRPPRSYRYDRVTEALSEDLGETPFLDPYAYVSYDIVWSLAYSISLVGYDCEAVKAVLPQVTESLLGASGEIVLNVAGDRDFGDYGLWRIEVASPYEWVPVGVYRALFDFIRWFS